MAWTPLFFFFVLHCSGSFSQLVLTQSSSASFSLGASAKLTCTLSSQHSTYTIEWYQQQPLKPPKYVMELKKDGSHSTGDGIPDRFSGSSSGADRYLSISNIQPEDEAIYICGVGDTIKEQFVYVFGGGTKVTVLGQPKSTPTLTVFPPSSEELKENKATLVCLISNFSPSGVTVAWKANGTPITQGVDTSNPTKEGNKFMASSFLHLTSDQWRSHNSFTCQVTHEGDTVEKSLSPAECL